jgi:hypothetical protein
VGGVTDEENAANPHSFRPALVHAVRRDGDDPRIAGTEAERGEAREPRGRRH